MSEGRIADIFDIEGRFLRSAHLERDFYDSAALAGYVVTDFARSSLSRIGEGLKPNSGQRAWRITGHYGAGKSSRRGRDYCPSHCAELVRARTSTAFS